MIFISIPELKAKLQVKELPLIVSPKTGKKFISTFNLGIPCNLKVEQAIDPKKEVKFMYESEILFTEGCMVNVTPTAPPIHVW